MKFDLFTTDKTALFCIEESAFSGVQKVAGKVLEDFNQLSGKSESLRIVSKDCFVTGKNAVLFATVGASDLVEKLLRENKIDLAYFNDKKEVFGWFLLENPWEGLDELLLIVGKDKLGTIYGAFELSEKMGVSPLVFWADAVMNKKDSISVESDEIFFSKVPSVEYRGFFINDEWPCFGNWTMEHFGGFTKEMYDHVFELLLRLKGNYLWPAMWSSSFGWDGPGLANYELASEYGIYIGNSHHEPCLRAGEEYRHVRGPKSVYGDAWNYHANTKGIRKFWEDSMIERGKYDSVVTVGMRGEADTKILGDNATLGDNIGLLKDVITCQNELIKEAEEREHKKFPKMLALYKEVEPYYYGDEQYEGLCEWEGIEDVILMLCEDNNGYLRTVPDEKMRKHKAGFGMYYHVDYHGDPISYEWVDSSPLPLMWEEMTRAYENGIQKLWILNVGDLKHNEVPLSYFLHLAYDYETWGINAPNKTDDYLASLIDVHFGEAADSRQKKDILDVMTETTILLGMRRPEAMNAKVYHPCHYLETDRMLERIHKVEKKSAVLMESLSQTARDAYYSLTGFRTEAGMNLLKMWLYAGKNHLYAKQGRSTTNLYAKKVADAILRDRMCAESLASFKDGKWNGMQMAPHIGFTKWNEDGCLYPEQRILEPIQKPRMFVVRKDEEKVYDAQYGAPMRILVDDFCYPGVFEVGLTVCNAGIGELDVKVVLPDNDWVSTNVTNVKVTTEHDISILCDRAKLPKEKETVVAVITDGTTKVEVAISGKQTKENGKILSGRDGFCFAAKDFESASGETTIIDNIGCGMSAVKTKGDTTLTYNLDIEPGEYTVEIWSVPTNPKHRDQKLIYGITTGGKTDYYNAVSDTFHIGEGRDREWAKGVLEHKRVSKNCVKFAENATDFAIVAKSDNYMPMRILIYNEAHCPKESYLGPN